MKHAKSFISCLLMIGFVTLASETSFAGGGGKPVMYNSQFYEKADRMTHKNTQNQDKSALLSSVRKIACDKCLAKPNGKVVKSTQAVTPPNKLICGSAWGACEYRIYAEYTAYCEHQ